jgi:glyoxylase-like metal-dependent hydrolase (beta-lactamase superfamily II)
MPELWWILTSRRWIKVPITATLIEHRDGLVLFDTGLDPAIVTDPGYVSSPIGRFLLHRIFRLHIGPENALDKQLAGLGFAASDVKTVVVSHLHFDHVGGIAHVPQAELLVSEREWQILSEPHPEREWILREHIEIPGAKWRPIAFEPTDDPLFAPFGGCHDVTGDGSLVLLPTPGHTPGSLSMLVRSPPLPPILLVADLTYQTDLLMDDRVPGTGDATQLRSSFAKVRSLKAQLPELVIVAAHDPATANELKAAQR